MQNPWFVAPESRRESTPRSLFLAVFFSGAAALIYQILWLRRLGLVFGVSVYAVGTVLAAVMAGFALGSLLFGRLSDRLSRPALLLLVIQGGLGLYGLIFPFLLDGLVILLGRFSHVTETPFLLKNTLRFISGFFLLFPSAAMMGGILPVAGKVLIHSAGRIGQGVGGLSAFYHGGALLGCLGTPFFLLPAWGTQRTLWLGVGLHLLAGLLFIGTRRRGKEAISSEPPRGEPSGTPFPSNLRGLLFVAVIVEGFCATAYETLWTRLLTPFSVDKGGLIASTVFGAFLAGLAVGGWLVRRWADRSRGLMGGVGFLMAGAAVGFVLLFPLTVRLGRVFLEARLAGSERWLEVVGWPNTLFFCLLMIPATLMGMTFPLFARLFCPHLDGLGGRLGWLGFLDALGAVGGGFIVGFVLIDHLGVAQTGALLALVGGLTGLALLALDRQVWPPYRALGLLILLPLFSPFIFPNRSPEWHLWPGRVPEDRILYQGEDAATVVTVYENLEGERRLVINGSVSAFGEGDLVIDRLRGLVPTFLHPTPKTALAVGFGMGVAARALLIPGIRRLDCVELSPAVIQASKACYGDVQGGVLEDPRFRLLIEDGRNHLLYTDSTYDVISSNAVHARLSPFLYTQEFYRLCRSRLNPGGILCQWLTTNWMTEDEFKGLLSAFLSVFPHAQLWASGVSNLIVVGSESPLTLDVQRWETLLAHPDLQGVLQDPFLLDPLDDLGHFLAHYVCGEKALRAYAGSTPPETDDRTRVAFSRVVRPVCRPEIIDALVRFKENPPLDESRTGQAVILQKAAAEKAYLAGVLAFDGLQEREKGVQLLEEAVRLDPGCFRYRDCLASYLRLENRRSEAIRVLEPLRAVRSSVRLSRYLGMLYLESGEADQAVEALQPAVKAGDLLGRYFLALAWIGQGRYREAREGLHTLLVEHPGFRDARFQAGLAALMMGDPSGAWHDLAISWRQGYRRGEILRLKTSIPALSGSGTRKRDP